MDWISFTVEIENTGELQGWAAIHDIREQLRYLVPVLYETLQTDGGLERQTPGRKPYTVGFVFDCGVTWFAGKGQETVLFEISGKGCDWLREMQLETFVLQQFTDRMTRIDFAMDIVTDIRPQEFVAERENRKVRSESFVTSDTGETCYIGSRKSERYLRVYRYNPPHPRAKYLRLEFVARKDHAKHITGEYLRLANEAGGDKAIRSIVHSLGARYGLDHPAWTPESFGQVAIDTYRPERRSGKTERWLVAQCAPAFAKLVREGVISDPQAWLEEFFIQPLLESGDLEQYG